ncbi:zinc ribbon domain-containing protein [Microcoleus sp. B13-B4]|uniref:zinc ribbon domain-containing protein n=1 Tax=unclassified Microcoleus TaxID=2642155 RepID=UPI002FD2E1E5
MGWASRPSKKDGRDAHPTITIKIVSYLIRDPKLTTPTVPTFKLIKIESLNVKGMMANHKLAEAISDLGFYEFKRQLDMACKMYGANLVLVDQLFPSTKTCSNCGTKKDMPLSIRTFDCPACGISLR